MLCFFESHKWKEEENEIKFRMTLGYIPNSLTAKNKVLGGQYVYCRIAMSGMVRAGKRWYDVTRGTLAGNRSGWGGLV